MVTKQEVIEHLEKLGYTALDEEGVVEVIVEKPLSKSERNRLEGHIMETGYQSSWGWRVSGKGDKK